MHYTINTIHYTLYTIHYTLYTIHYTLYTIHYTLYTIHYTLYTIHCPHVRLSYCRFIPLSHCPIVPLTHCPIVPLSNYPFVPLSFISFVPYSLSPFVFLSSLSIPASNPCKELWGISQSVSEWVNIPFLEIHPSKQLHLKTASDGANRQKDRRTLWLYDSIGPVGRFSENHWNIQHDWRHHNLNKQRYHEHIYWD